MTLAAQCEIPPISHNTLSRVYRRRGGGFARVLPCFHRVSRKFAEIPLLWGGYRTFTLRALQSQQVPNPTPLNPAPATCHKRKRKLCCSFRNSALQKLHCNIRFSAVRKSFGPKDALQQTKNCTATSKKLRCRKVALSCRFPAGFKPPRLGTHV